MATKTVSVTLEAYERLKREKLEGESFSDVIIRLTERGKKDLIEFAGVWKEAEEIENAIFEGRKEFEKHAKILP
jgi:predicted CopG family antitoxin